MTAENYRLWSLVNRLAPVWAWAEWVQEQGIGE